MRYVVTLIDGQVYRTDFTAADPPPWLKFGAPHGEPGYLHILARCLEGRHRAHETLPVSIARAHIVSIVDAPIN